MATGRRQQLLRAGLALAAALVHPACVQDDGGLFNPIKDLATTDEDEEREIGLQFDRELRAVVPVVRDPLVAGFINDLGQAIVETIEPQPFVYRFRVVLDDSLNAFAVPGGYVYFHSGTVLSAASLDELAGVMGHEIAHVKAHHYARMRQKSQIPDLLAGLAGMAATVATGRPEPLVAAQAANVAVQLKWSREFETEADQLGTVFMTRAGYDPEGITHFFGRILKEQKRHPHNVPPYLFSHPDVEDRIGSVRIQAEKLEPQGTPDPRLEEAFREAQARLAWLLANRRESLPPGDPPERPELVEPALARAEDLAQEGRFDEALLILARAESQEPRDPRVPFRIAELLAAQGRHEEASAAFRRTIRLDPSRALVFYQLGLSQKELGSRHAAVHAFEQAAQRSGATSVLRQRAEWQIETLVFPVLLEAGFADGREDLGETPLGDRVNGFAPGTRPVAWVARLHSRYGGYPARMSQLWIDPRGQVVAETEVRSRGGPWVGSVLDLPGGVEAEGRWTVETRYDRDVLQRDHFSVQPSPR